jgi:Na+/proline symporter
MMLVALSLYAIALIAVCRMRRPGPNYLDFAIADRSTGSFATAFGIFTLIGGGELIAGSAYGYRYGWTGVTLFVGYAIGFALLGLLSPRIRSEMPSDTVSYVDVSARAFGPAVARVVLFAQAGAFWALLVLQLAAGGALISQLTSVPHSLAVVACAVTVVTYLVAGGFRAVVLTDIIQGCIMFLLLALVLFVARQAGPAVEAVPPVGFDASWGTLIGGIIVGLASADVWQRLLAAQTSRAARAGLIGGSLVLALYGAAVIYLGIVARASEIAQTPDSAFLDVLGHGLPPAVLYCALFGTLAAILSTADTEIFLVASLLERHARRRATEKGTAAGPFRTRYLYGVTASAAFVALWSTDLALLIELMYSTYLAFAPTIALTLFFDPGTRGFLASVAVSLLLYAVMLAGGVLEQENAYLLSAPAALIVPSMAWLKTHASQRRDLTARPTAP